MTIIAVHSDMMGADSVAWAGDINFPVPPGREKVYRVPGGGLIGACGATPDIDTLRRWALAGMDFGNPPTFADHDDNSDQKYPIMWLWLKIDGTLHVGNSRMVLYSVATPYAIGMAPAVAMWLGAVLSGAGMRSALLTAITRCAYVGGSPQIEHL